MKGTHLDTEEVEVLDMVPAFKKFVILGLASINASYIKLKKGSKIQPEPNEAGYEVETLEPDH